MAITRWHRQTKCTVHAKPPNKSCLLQTVAAKHTWPLHKAGPCITHLKPELLGLQSLAKKRFIFSPPHQPLQVGRSFSFFLYNTGNLHALFPTHATTVTQARNTLSQWPIKKNKIASNANILVTCSAHLKDLGKMQCCLFQPQHETEQVMK